MGSITEFSSKRCAPCELLSVAGRALKLRSPLPVALRASVKVEEGNRLWMGEVWACEPDAGGYTIELESDLMFRDVAATEYMAGHFREPGKEAGAAGEQAVGPAGKSPVK